MEFSIKLHTIKQGWSIVAFEVYQVIVLENIVFIRHNMRLLIKICTVLNLLYKLIPSLVIARNKNLDQTPQHVLSYMGL